VSRLVPLSFGTRRVDDCDRGHENTDYLINRLLRQSIHKLSGRHALYGAGLFSCEVVAIWLTFTVVVALEVSSDT